MEPRLDFAVERFRGGSLPLKDVIQEKCGDGIMSAIDFTLTVDKLEDAKGDRVKVTMNGKFLPYRKW